MSKVFISYSHDSEEHREKVLALSERLRADGIETVLDQYLNGSPPEGWPRWMLDRLDAADFVLVVCTETYYRRFRGHEQPGKGRGVDWEGALITQEIYDSRSRTLKFVPVFLSATVDKWIPEPLRSRNHYALTSKSAYDSLYDLLMAQAGVEPGELGRPKPKARRKGMPLTFDDPEPVPTPPPLPPHAAASLFQILIGRWQLQIQPPFAQGVMGQMNLDLFPNGLFRGQLINPMGVTGVEGQWQANPIQNQIGLQGMQSNGFQVIPYAVLVQVTGLDAHQITGITGAGEQVRWQRLNPPNTPPPMSPF